MKKFPAVKIEVYGTESVSRTILKEILNLILFESFPELKLKVNTKSVSKTILKISLADRELLSAQEFFQQIPSTLKIKKRALYIQAHKDVPVYIVLMIVSKLNRSFWNVAIYDEDLEGHVAVAGDIFERSPGKILDGPYSD